MRPTDSHGAKTLRAICGRATIAAVATKAGVQESAIRHVLRGRRTPSRKFRTALGSAYGIALDAWSPSAAPEPGRQASAPAPLARGANGATVPQGEPTAPDLDAKATCTDTIRRLALELERLDSAPDATSRDRAAVASSLTAATRLLARLSGQLEVTQVQIVRSAPWRHLMDLLDEVLAHHPKAASEWAAKLRAEDESS